MANEIDSSRRKFLLNTTTVLGAAGTAYFAYPFLSSWQPSAKAIAAGAPVYADVSKIKPGEVVVYSWRSKPVIILRRTEKMIANLKDGHTALRDPNSHSSIQPKYAQNILRSKNPEFFVALNVCTHLGCTPLFKPMPKSLFSNWPGGFYCPCHGSMYDLAGRVFTDVPAPTNLQIPKYKFVKDSVILIGEDNA